MMRIRSRWSHVAAAVLTVGWWSAAPVRSQILGPFNGRFMSLSQNSVSSVDATGDRVWTGPGLNAYDPTTMAWTVPLNADSVFGGGSRVFSLSVDGASVFAGLGRTISVDGSSVPVATGYHLSVDGGDIWSHIPFPADPPSLVSDCNSTATGVPAGCDTTFTYGGRLYERIRVTVPEQSPPYETAVSGGTLMSVNWASGLLRSLDSGGSWDRIPLPPFDAAAMSPDGDYEWISQLPGGVIVNRYDPRYDNNLLGFGLLLDRQGRTWVGTAGGLNVSPNASHAPVERIEWVHRRYLGQRDGLIGNWIISIRQNPFDDAVWMTQWPAAESGEMYGLAVTRDGGETFETMLFDEKINDIGFHGPNIAAAGTYLHISTDNGASWRRIGAIESGNDRLSSQAEFYAASGSSEGVYIGSSEGLLFTPDGGRTWSIERTQFPLSGGNVYVPDAASVKAYLYPNPFSPDRHDIVRLRFSAFTPGRYQARIFDSGMDEVATIEASVDLEGEYELIWNGRTARGGRAHNGVYVVRLTGPGFSSTLKLLILN